MPWEQRVKRGATDKPVSGPHMGSYAYPTPHFQHLIVKAMIVTFTEGTFSPSQVR